MKDFAKNDVAIKLDDDNYITRASDEAEVIEAAIHASFPEFISRREDGSLSFWQRVDTGGDTSDYVTGEVRGLQFTDWVLDAGLSSTPALRRIVEDMGACGDAGSPASLGFFTVIGSRY